MKRAKNAVVRLFLAMAVVCLLSAGAAAETIELEVAVFDGAFGTDFFEYVAREYEEMHPNVEVTIQGSPEIGIVLRPRFLQGNPPDVTWLVREGITNAELLRAGLIHPITEAMHSPAYFQEDKKWKETIMPGTLRTLTDGSDEIWGVSLDLLTWNMWYNPQMFEEYGWEPPQTFADLMALGDEIRQEGIVPIALQGQIADYNIYWVMQFIQRQAGMDALNSVLNLEEGAWLQDGVLEAVRKFRMLKDEGFFQSGAMGMDHMEAQTQFVMGDAAMVANGSWMPAEMGGIAPDDFEMVPFQYPKFEDGVGDPNALNVMDAEKWIVPRDADHPEQAVDFLKFLTSKPMAQEFVQQKDAMTTVVGANVDLSEELQIMADMVEEADRTFTHVPIQGWYPEWFGTWADNTTSLLLGELDPEDYVEVMERASERTREDPNVELFEVDF